MNDYEALITLPKGHPVREIAFWSYMSSNHPVKSQPREAERMIALYFHPFGADLAACAETNS